MDTRFITQLNVLHLINLIKCVTFNCISGAQPMELLFYVGTWSIYMIKADL